MEMIGRNHRGRFTKITLQRQTRAVVDGQKKIMVRHGEAIQNPRRIQDETSRKKS